MMQLISSSKKVNSENFMFVSACHKNNFAINQQKEIIQFPAGRHQQLVVLDSMMKQVDSNAE